MRLPQGVFNPYAGVNTNLIFFTKDEPTKEIWYYQLPLPEGMKQYSKNRGIIHKEFDIVRRSLGVGGSGPHKRKESEHMWRVSIKEIQERNYNMDFKNPNGNSKVVHKDPKEVLESIANAESQIAKILGEIKKVI